MQIVSPQGSMNPILQYSMLGSFVLVLACYAVALMLVLSQGSVG